MRETSEHLVTADAEISLSQQQFGGLVLHAARGTCLKIFTTLRQYMLERTSPMHTTCTNAIPEETFTHVFRPCHVPGQTVISLTSL